MQRILHTNIKSLYHKSGIDETEYSKIVSKRKEKLEKFDLLKKEGCSEKTILLILDISRASFFRWKSRYKKLGLSGLETESKRPVNTRKSTWSLDIERKIYYLRREYPLFGKYKIAVLYQQKYKKKISVSMVGRIISKLIRANKIKSVNFLCNRKLSKSRIFNGHAQRWKKGMKALNPGEFIQIDHMTINIHGIGYVKQFNAICPITKIAVEKIYSEATARNAANFLEYVIQQMPFPIRSIQVDGGSEFMKEFELLCKNLNIPLFVLPPKSPECNAYVERSNGTFKYEFYSQYSGKLDFESLQKSLLKFVNFYNNIRPHQSLGYLTPNQFYESIKMEAKSLICYEPAQTFAYL